MDTIIETPTPEDAHQDVRDPARPRLPAWLRAVLTPILFIAALMAMQVVVMLIPGLHAMTQTEGWVGAAAVTILSVLALAITVGLIALLMRFIDRAPFRRAGLVWTRHSLPGLLLGLAAAAVLAWIAIGAGLALGQVRTVDVPPGLVTVQSVALVIVVGLVRAFLLQGMPEEFLFRGYLMQVLARRPVVACWASAALFAVIHLLSNGGQQNAVDRVAYLAVPLGFGLLAAALAVRLRSVWPAVGIHAGFHVAMIPCQIFGIAAEGRFFWLAAGGLFLLAGLVAMRGLPKAPVVLDR
ncbi:CPBP family intramembrane glutamic endopeptidase [Mariniluteicoccus flavus]